MLVSTDINKGKGNHIIDLDISKVFVSKDASYVGLQGCYDEDCIVSSG